MLLESCLVDLKVGQIGHLVMVCLRYPSLSTNTIYMLEMDTIHRVAHSPNIGSMYIARVGPVLSQLQMLLFPNTLCCSLFDRNCVCAVTKIFTKFLPANNFCQLLRVTRKRSCTSVGDTQAQLHFRDDQQRVFRISNISNWP